ncbi:hypothetical protein Tco_0115544 [Tanacetum coccineum]
MFKGHSFVFPIRLVNDKTFYKRADKEHEARFSPTVLSRNTLGPLRFDTSIDTRLRGALASTILKDSDCYKDILIPFGDGKTKGEGVSVWEGAEEVQSIIHIKAEKCKNMKHSQDMQLIQKLRDDQKRMKKVFEVMSGRNIVTNSRVTPSWREIVSLTFSEAGVLHVNWISFGHCVLRRGLLC